MFRPEEVRHVAALARLTLADDEIDATARALGRVLEYMEVLQEAEEAEEAGEAASAASAAGASGREVEDPPAPLRPDETGEVLSRPEALASAPRSDGETFLVPPVLEGGEGP